MSFNSVGFDEVRKLRCSSNFELIQEMATAGRRIHPSEDMGGRAVGYGGVLQSRMSDIDASPHSKVQSITLEEARYSDMRKRIGLPRVPKDRITVTQDYDKVFTA